MKIIADCRIPLVQQAFANIGDVTLCEGRQITPDLLSDADILLVRTVTRVNKDLLKNSKVRFVATATSGIDHIDTGYLQDAGIEFASAHGCNAQSVVEYVLSSLFVLADQNDFNLFEKSVGIIGCGKVGSRLLSVLQTLNISCVVNDPPLKDSTGDDLYVGLPDVIDSDIVSLHVPLTDSGKYPTKNLISGGKLAHMKQDAILINTSRGQVVNEQNLKNHLGNNKKFSVVLDVWENEPDINLDLLKLVSIGTPHIAGYGIDAKIRATQIIYAEACRNFNISRDWEPQGDFLDLGLHDVRIDTNLVDQDAIQLAVLSHYDARSDAASLRRMIEIEADKAGYFFDELRNNYPLRRNFSATTVHLPEQRTELANTLTELGFTISLHT